MVLAAVKMRKEKLFDTTGAAPTAGIKRHSSFCALADARHS